MKKPTIAASRAKFRKVLLQYVKHKGLDIEVTLKDGNRLIVSKMRHIEGENLIQLGKRGERSSLRINDIQNLEVFVN